MLIKRTLQDQILKKLQSGNKAIILYGPRQVGKTTLINQIMEQIDYRTLTINADETRYVDVLSSRDARKLEELVSGYELLFIDEAQRIPDIGINLKILVDQFPQLKVIATGSSSFELASRISEPLTGRAWIYNLYPISLLELSNVYNHFELKQELDSLLVYGSYPELFSIKNREEKEQYLRLLSTSYLYRDVLELANLKNAHKIRDLLRLIAFQIGSEVSLTELGTQLEMSKDTVNRYIDLLEKAFVLFRVGGLSRNLQKEVSKMDKIYFYDLGIRNAVIDNLKSLNQRDDVGKLWENFLITERKKLLSYQQKSAGIYYWRTYSGAELDYLEDRDGKLHGYEFKYRHKRAAKAPKTWIAAYHNATFQVIDHENFLNFTLKA